MVVLEKNVLQTVILYQLLKLALTAVTAQLQNACRNRKYARLMKRSAAAARFKRARLTDIVGVDLHASTAAAQMPVILRLLARLQTADGLQADLWKKALTLTCMPISRVTARERLSISTYTKTMSAHLTITRLQNQ
jgi:hypothetical protein